MLKKRLLSFKYAFQGLIDLFSTQPNAVFHLFSSIIVIVLGFYLDVSNTEWCLLILCIVLVISAEAFNTSLEYLTDLVSPEHHPLAGKTKDVAAGAVLVIAIGALIIGTIIFLPKILYIIK